MRDRISENCVDFAWFVCDVYLFYGIVDPLNHLSSNYTMVLCLFLSRFLFIWSFFELCSLMCWWEYYDLDDDDVWVDCFRNVFGSSRFVHRNWSHQDFAHKKLSNREKYEKFVNDFLPFPVMFLHNHCWVSFSNRYTCFIKQ